MPWASTSFQTGLAKTMRRTCSIFDLSRRPVLVGLLPKTSSNEHLPCKLRDRRSISNQAFISGPTQVVMSNARLFLGGSIHIAYHLTVPSHRSLIGPSPSTLPASSSNTPIALRESFSLTALSSDDKTLPLTDVKCHLETSAKDLDIS